MDDRRTEVNKVLLLIQDTDLSHPAGPILESFIEEAFNPILAARYVKQRLLEDDPRLIVYDWVYIVESVATNGKPPPSLDSRARQSIMKRDGGKCCITGKVGSLRDPLVVVPILGVPLGWIANKIRLSLLPRIFDMLGVFFNSQYRDWWLSYVEELEFMSTHHTHWLVRQSAAKAFAQGLIRLDRLPQSMIEFEVNDVLLRGEEQETAFEVDGRFPLLGDHSRSGIATIDARFVGTHARFSKSIRLIQIAKTIAPEVLSQNSSISNELVKRRLSLKPQVLSERPPSSISFLSETFLTLWLLLPRKIRIVGYETLRKIGQRRYGLPDVAVQRLPFGLYLKYQGDAESHQNEFNALATVYRETSLPVPKPLDVLVGDQVTGDPFTSYLLMTRLPGLPLSSCHNLLSDHDFEHIANQMKDYMAQLRNIRNKVNTAIAICNTLGEACKDARIAGEKPVVPFVDEAAFNQVVRFSDDPARRGHKIVFTHADLNLRNILVDQYVRSDGIKGWKLTGIVDWEMACFLPEYWDYTKAMFEGFRWPRRYNNWVKRVFEAFDDYSKEYEVEKRSWESGDGV
ncbi:hypothetical protein PT974_04802 [Cladobotryum mycophilum]|uniref:Aminoglycoside phosphotransferase domain-containing protein n=1 Tax=Cladobotryum mycophilum TaxID=491253 RepID=A0ABR0SQ63_9HYPO